MKRIMPALAAVVLLLTACGWTGTGDVLGKYYQPPWTSFIMSGKVMVPVMHPACHGITLDTRDGKQRSFCISKTVWERVEPGQEFTITKE